MVIDSNTPGIHSFNFDPVSILLALNDGRSQLTVSTFPDAACTQCTCLPYRLLFMSSWTYRF